MQFISIKQVCELIGLSRSQITERDENGKPRAGMEDFPDPLFIGYRRLYDRDEVEAWQRKRLEERGTKSPPKRERKSKTTLTNTVPRPQAAEDGTDRPSPAP